MHHGDRFAEPSLEYSELIKSSKVLLHLAESRVRAGGGRAGGVEGGCAYLRRSWVMERLSRPPFTALSRPRLISRALPPPAAPVAP